MEKSQIKALSCIPRQAAALLRCGLALLLGALPCRGGEAPAPPPAAGLPQADARPRLLGSSLAGSEGAYTLSLLYFEEGENACFRVDLQLRSLAQFPHAGRATLLNPSRESYVREWSVPQQDVPMLVRETVTRTQDADSAQLSFAARPAAGQAAAPQRVEVDAAATGGETLLLHLSLALELRVRCESSSTDITPRPGQPPLESTSELREDEVTSARLRWDESIAFCPAAQK